MDNEPMTRGEQLTNDIRDQLECPQCEYSLRGLPGEDVKCPECGQSINIASLISSRWIAPWHRAPLFNTLAYPVAWLCGGLLASFALLIAAYPRESPPVAVFLAFLTGLFVVWILVLLLIRKAFGDIEGIWLSLLLHGVFIAYFVGLIGAFAMIANLYLRFQGWNLPMMGVQLFWLAFMVALVIGARWGERFVAKRCIRRHLRLKAEATLQS